MLQSSSNEAVCVLRKHGAQCKRTGCATLAERREVGEDGAWVGEQSDSGT